MEQYNLPAPRNSVNLFLAFYVSLLVTPLISVPYQLPNKDFRRHAPPSFHHNCLAENIATITKLL